jgi:hypothetical protein
MILFNQVNNRRSKVMRCNVCADFEGVRRGDGAAEAPKTGTDW